MTKVFTLCFATLLAGFSLHAQEPDTSQVINSIEDSLNDNTEVFVSSLEDLDGSSNGGNVSGLLQSSRDVYASTAGFNFFAARFRIRGYNSDRTTILINGVPSNDMESGWGTWYKWGGLNDVTRYAETKNWLTSNPYHFGGIGGYSNINTKASSIRKGYRISYAYTNRAYSHRPMITYGTGVMANGWSFAYSLSGRYAQEGYIEGTFQEGFSYYAAAEKQISDKQSFYISVFGSRRERGKQSISVQEAYDLTGDIYYNAYWGWQTAPDGSRFKRSGRIASEHVPVISLGHEWEINKNSKWTNSAYISFGKYGQRMLNWYDAPDPRPDYYRYLPSYYEGINDPDNAAAMAARWNNEDYRQINWDQLYFANNNNLYQVENAEGIEGNTIEGKRAKYVMENQWNNHLQTHFASVYSNSKDNRTITAGAYFQLQRNHVYKTMNDLLGADFWVDVDQFAEQDFVDPSAAQNDINNPNNVIGVGDVYGWNYYIYNMSATGFGQVDYTFNKIDFYAAAELSQKMFWREGLFQNGRFPDNSFGKSETHSFFNYAIKGGAVYKITGRQFLSANAAYLTNAPLSRNSFVSPRTRDNVVEGLENEQIYTADINYIIRYPKLKLRATYYYTEEKNLVWSRSFYHDQYRSFVNYAMTGVDYLHQGIEFGVEGEIYGGLSANGVIGYGQHLYNSRPTSTVYVDNSAELLDENKTIYLQNYKIGGMPQSAASAGLRYSGKKYWFAGVNFNYFMDIYLDPNPDRRTEEAVAGFVEDDPQVAELLDQTKLDNGYTVSIIGGKSFKFNEYYLSLFFNVSNLTNNTNFITGGYEQLRYDKVNTNKFPPKVGYIYGLNYFLMATLRF